MIGRSLPTVAEFSGERRRSGATEVIVRCNSWPGGACTERHSCPLGAFDFAKGSVEGAERQMTGLPRHL